MHINKEYKQSETQYNNTIEFTKMSTKTEQYKLIEGRIYGRALILNCNKGEPNKVTDCKSICAKMKELLL